MVRISVSNPWSSHLDFCVGCVIAMLGKTKIGVRLAFGPRVASRQRTFDTVLMRCQNSSEARLIAFLKSSGASETLR